MARISPIFRTERTREVYSLTGLQIRDSHADAGITVGKQALYRSREWTRTSSAKCPKMRFS